MAAAAQPSSLRSTRMLREIALLQTPTPGISVWPDGDNIYKLSAVVEGLYGSPYEGGKFRLDIQIPQRFPFEPPNVQFVTPIYHPNVDDRGRICLDILKMPPKGSWRPSVHISGVLNSIRLLMQEPNPDDPLLDEIAAEFKSNYPLFCRKARQSTQKHATSSQSHSNVVNQCDSKEETTATSARENQDVSDQAIKPVTATCNQSTQNPTSVDSGSSTKSVNATESDVKPVKPSFKALKSALRRDDRSKLTSDVLAKRARMGDE